MTSVAPKRRFSLPLTFAFAGAAAGIINGMLGTGGGIITFFILTKIYAADSEYSTKDVFAMTYLSTALMSVASVLFYLGRGTFSLPDAAPYMLPAVTGGAVGAFLLDKADVRIFKKLFAILVIWAGLSMMIK